MKKNFSILKISKKKGMLALFFVLSNIAMATTSDAPWVGMLTKVMNILVGPTARIISILALFVIGALFITGQTEHVGKRAMNVIIGISIMFAAASWGPSFFGYSGAVLL